MTKNNEKFSLKGEVGRDIFSDNLRIAENCYDLLNNPRLFDWEENGVLFVFASRTMDLITKIELKQDKNAFKDFKASVSYLNNLTYNIVCNNQKTFNKTDLEVSIFCFKLALLWFYGLLDDFNAETEDIEVLMFNFFDKDD